MNKLISFLCETPQGRTIQRAIKTFVYACLGFYVTNKVAPFEADWLSMVEVGLLAALGFSVDKGIREYKNQ